MIIQATTMPDMTGTYLNYLWISLGALAIFCVLIWLGWRNRKRRQKGIPAPVEIPAGLLESDPDAAAEGMVIGTVNAEDYLDRVAVHELGLRAHGRIELHRSGIAIFRAGVRNVFVPQMDLRYVRTDRGVVGKFVERDGVIILGWQLGDAVVETAFRPRHVDEGQTLLTAVKRITEATSPEVTSPEPPSTDRTMSEQVGTHQIKLNQTEPDQINPDQTNAGESTTP